MKTALFLATPDNTLTAGLEKLQAGGQGVKSKAEEAMRMKNLEQKIFQAFEQAMPVVLVIAFVYVLAHLAGWIILRGAEVLR